MKILITGSGAREHALAWACARSPLVDQVLLAPGNGGTAALYRNLPVAADDPHTVVEAALEHEVALVVLGPEASVAAGVGDALRRHGVLVFGPDQEAGRIETSKAHAKQLMTDAGIPTAAYGVFDDPLAAADFSEQFEGRVAVKADGLAQGKGVVLADAVREVEDIAREMIEGRAFGDAGARIVVEEQLSGREVSIFGVTDGERVVTWPPARDFKRAQDGDEGPNTGGMGAYSPPADAGHEVLDVVQEQVLEPVVRILRERGTPYRGVIYAGLMLTSRGPKVIEFNCRFGDPEAQVLLPRIDGDVVPLLLGAATGDLTGTRPHWSRDYAVGVVVASGGYPGPYQTGYPISGLDAVDPGTLVFHAGTRLDPETGSVVTAGGRVLTVVACAATLEEARRSARSGAARVAFPGAFHRRDIAEESISA
ncbi:MAG: phosphoribosylamine--glycine ligase [Candidatus Dormibacteraeota bacterium]|nr:phosphoribosylamine--glycine ligase [Candidatus Dormibacteraeota bacterium]MBO0745955.1 phosphoribosylamine--glycine ligase [Candidatus Dormibacteraeota bacterium]